MLGPWILFILVYLWPSTDKMSYSTNNKECSIKTVQMFSTLRSDPYPVLLTKKFIDGAVYDTAYT